jgi:predicted transcriptional regulator
MEKPFPVVGEDTSLTEVSNHLDRDTGAVLVRNASGFDIITRADLIFFLTKQKT